MSLENHNVLALPGDEYEEIYHNVPKAVKDAAKRRHPAYIGREHLIDGTADQPIPAPEVLPTLSLISPELA